MKQCYQITCGKTHTTQTTKQETPQKLQNTIPSHISLIINRQVGHAQSLQRADHNPGGETIVIIHMLVYGFQKVSPLLDPLRRQVTIKKPHATLVIPISTQHTTPAGEHLQLPADTVFIYLWTLH
jgi:hypothetical protein